MYKLTQEPEVYLDNSGEEVGHADRALGRQGAGAEVLFLYM